MTDKQTLDVYAARADDYAKLVAKDGTPRALPPFTDALPPGGTVLDWGCGAGSAAAAMRDLGFTVTATDASPEFAALVERTYGIKVRVETFDDLDAENAFDGIWASFSLLHAPKAKMARHLASAYRALKPGGQFYLGMKLGDGEARDTIGRFYAYYTEAELEGLLADAGFTITHRRHGEEPGLDGQMWPFLLIYAHA